MTQIQPAPIGDLVLEEQTGKFRPSWILWFQQLLFGDIGNKWTPIATNLTATGTPTITGNYYQNQGFTDFYIRIQPGTDTSSTAGTTYFDLPFGVVYDAPCHATSGVQSAPGAVVAAVKRVFPPTWSAITVPVTNLRPCEVAMIFARLNHSEINAYWPVCREILKPAFRAKVHVHCVDDYEDGLMKGDLQLWAAVHNDQIIGAVVTVLEAGSQAKILNIMSLAGKDYKEWAVMLDNALTDFARENGCQAIEAVTRPGFGKYSPEFVEDGRVYVKVLGEAK